MNKLVLFLMLMFCQIICAFALSLLQPFFPPYALEKGISELEVGIIFSANPFGAITAALLIGKVLTKDNRYVFICSGLFMQAIGLFLFAATKYQDRTWIIITGIIARLINGFGTSAYITPVYAYISVLYKDSIEQKLSIAEVSLAIGFMLGPVFGSLLYSIGGYNLPFISFGVLATVFVPVLWFTLKVVGGEVDLEEPLNVIIEESPDKLSPTKDELLQKRRSGVPSESARKSHNPETFNRKSVEAMGSVARSLSSAQMGRYQTKHLRSSQNDESPLAYTNVLVDYSVLMTAVSGFCVSFMFNFLSPINANYLHDQYDIDVGQVGYYLIVMPIGYSLSSFVISNVKKYQTWFIFGGGICIGIASLFAGPDTYIVQLNPSIACSITGLTLMGASASSMIVFNIPVINNILLDRYPRKPNQCANMASALYTSGTFCGELIGPISAGLLQQYYGYARAVTCMGGLIFFFSVMYIPVALKHGQLKNEKVEDAALETPSKQDTH